MMDQKQYLSVFSMDTPVGPLTLASYDRRLCHIDFGTLDETRTKLAEWAKSAGLPADLRENETDLADAAAQIRSYFSGERKGFDLNLLMKGTAFQKKVWMALAHIPYGETRTYKDIAADIGNPQAVRAVGGANNKNPLPIVIPCHRVIGTNGSLVGYGGGLGKKSQMLLLEKQEEKETVTE